MIFPTANIVLFLLKWEFEFQLKYYFSDLDGILGKKLELQYLTNTVQFPDGNKTNS